MARRLVKNIKYGPKLTDVISIRPHGSKVRIHDAGSGQILMLDPDIARAAADAMKFAAKHATITKPLAYQLYEAELKKMEKA
jgi:hypothetical protein